MNLIALLVGLAIERLATQFFHWRRMRWMDRIIDAGFQRAAGLSNWPTWIPVVLLAAILALPVFLVTVLLGDALLGFPYLALAIVVLFFSLGPQDIGEDVDEYCAALNAGDEEQIRHTAKALVEGDVSDVPEARMHQVESAVFVQANNRLFAVIFWFMALGPLGPLGAWAYRVTDLIRRRAVFAASRDAEEAGDDGGIKEAAVRLHGWFTWVPARITALGYGVAGHLDGALAAWRAPLEPLATSSSQANEMLLARVGNGALALADQDGESVTERSVRGAHAANRLVFRQLLIWAVIISALTLYGWSL